MKLFGSPRKSYVPYTSLWVFDSPLKQQKCTYDYIALTRRNVLTFPNWKLGIYLHKTYVRPTGQLSNLTCLKGKIMR